MKLHANPAWVTVNDWLKGVPEPDDGALTTRLAVRAVELPFSVVLGAAAKDGDQMPVPLWVFPVKVIHEAVLEMELGHVEGDPVMLMAPEPPEDARLRLPAAAAEYVQDWLTGG